MRKFLSIFVASALAVAASVAQAQEYPTREVKIVIPTTPGGTIDAAGRVLQQALTNALGQPVVLENIPGGGSTVGVGQVVRSKPDGYTLVLALNSPVVMAPYLNANLPYDPSKDLKSIGIFGHTYTTLVVRSDSPFHTVADIVKAAKENPGKLSFGSIGVGTAHQIAGELLNKKADINITHIPFSGTSQAVQNLLGGHIDMSYASLAAVLPHTKAGTLRMIAMADTEHPAGQQDVPLIIDTVPGAGIPTAWLALFAPNGIPDDVAKRLGDALAKAMNDPEVVQGLLRVGVEPYVKNSEEADALIREELVSWKGIIAEAGLSAN